MTAKIVDVPNASTGTPANFGTLPGFGISQHVGQPVPNSFVQSNPGSADRFVSYTTGIGDILKECFAASCWTDTGLFLTPQFDGGARGADISGPHRTSGRYYTSSPPFMADHQGSFGPTFDFGDDGIGCFDASPTDGGSGGYSAMYLGNKCQTSVGSLTLGAQAPAPSFGVFEQGGFIIAAAGSTQPCSLVTDIGTLNIIAFQRNQSLVDDLPGPPGWTRLFIAPHGAPPANQTMSMTVYWRIFQAGDSPTLSITFPTAFTGGLIGFNYNNVARVTAVIGTAAQATDGTAADCPGVTTSTFNNTVVGIVTKLAPSAGSGFTAPAGWTMKINARLGNNVGADAHWMGVTDRAFPTAGTATGTISLGGASSSFGTAVTLLLDHGPGLTSAATSGNVSYTDLGFQPDAMMFLLCDPAGPGEQDGTAWMYGAADASLNQWVAIGRSVFLSGPSALGGLANQVQRRRRFYSDACIGHIGAIRFAGATTNDVKASLVSMDSDGFTLNIATMTDPLATVFFFAVKATPGRGAVKVGNASSRTATGSQAISGLGFRPDGIVFGSAQTTTTTLQTTFGASVFGMTDGTTRRSYWARADTGIIGNLPPCCPTQWFGDKVITYADAASATMLSQADLASIDADGFTLNWGTADGNAYLYGWIAFQVDEDPVAEPVAITDPYSSVIKIGTTVYVSYNGRIIPNSVVGEPVSYSFEASFDQTMTSSVFSTGFSVDGDGTSEVAVTKLAAYNAFVFDPTTAPFCYRIVVRTQQGCIVPGNIVCPGVIAPALTFGNKFRMEQ